MMSDNNINDTTKISSDLLHQRMILQTQVASAKIERNDDEIDLAELWRATWAGKWVIIAIAAMFAVASVVYALSLPNIYKSEALLAPVAEEGGGLGGMASQFGGLASIAGINLGGSGGIEQTALAIEIMKSRVFVAKFIEQHDLLIPLMAVKGWSQHTNELIYNAEIYSIEDNKWIISGNTSIESRPSAQKAYKRFRSIFTISQDPKSSMVNVSVEHFSPIIAQQWVTWLVDAINIEMKTRDLNEAQKSKIYLEQQLSSTKVNELQNVLYQLIEEQTKTIMFANVREQYIFKTIDPALVPELKKGPKRALICVLGVLLGGIFGVFIVLIRHFRSNNHELR